MGYALVANNAATTLSAAISTTGATSLTVVSAAKFPVPSGGNYFYATILDAANVPEIVKVTAVAGTTFTIVRGQDGTTARTFTSGASVRLCLCTALWSEFARLDSPAFTNTPTAPTASVGATGTQLATLDYTIAEILSRAMVKVGGYSASGTHNFTGATLTVATPTASNHAVNKAYADGLVFSATLPSSAGNGGFYMTTDGTTPFWGQSTIGGVKVTHVSGTTVTGTAGQYLSLENVAATAVTANATPVDDEELWVCANNGLTTNTVDFGAKAVRGPQGTLNIVILDTPYKWVRFKFSTTLNVWML